MEKVNAVLLTGTHADKAKLIYGENKAFAKIKGKPLIVNSLEAIKKAKYIDKMLIVGPREKLRDKLEEKIITGIQIIEESKAPTESRRFIENAGRGYDILSPNGKRTVFVPCDPPFIASETIDDFILKCNNYNAAFYFALINVKNIPPGIENLKRSARFHLKDKGYYRTANLILFEGSKIKKMELLLDQIKQVFEKRRPTSKFSKYDLYFFLARKYFWREVFKYVTIGLKEKDVESAIKREFGFSFKLIETKDPRAAIDIDYEDECKFVKEHYEEIGSFLSKTYPTP